MVVSKLVVRSLERGDLTCGFLETLDSLKSTSGMRQEKAEEIFDMTETDPNRIIAVAIIDRRVVGTATLLVEQKFIHCGGMTGHIEDVAVHKDHQGAGVGTAVVQFLLEAARVRGCYKTILDCKDDLVPYYERLGFRLYSNGMRIDH